MTVLLPEDSKRERQTDGPPGASGRIWSTRTERAGAVFSAAHGDDEQAQDWVRWRLAVEMHRRWFALCGAAVLPFVFEPMDGDTYSLPVASRDCSFAPTYFGRLSRSAIRVHLDDQRMLAADCQFSTDALLGDHDSPATEWASYSHWAWRQLGLQAATAGDHSDCWHASAHAHYPLIYELAVWLRTRGRLDGADGCIAPARSDQPELRSRLATQGYSVLPGEPADWIEVNTADGDCWLGPRGHVLDRQALLRLDPAVPAQELAGQVVDHLRTGSAQRGLSPEPGVAPFVTAVQGRQAFRRRAEVMVADLFLPGTPYTPAGWALPSAMSFFADATTLVVAVAPAPSREVDKGLAYGLAHADTRELVLLLPAGQANPTALRSAYLDRSIRLFEHDGITTQSVSVPCRQDVLDALREKRLRGGEHDLGVKRSEWVRELETWAGRHPDLAQTHRAGYRSWQCAGRRLLELRASRHGQVSVVAGVQASGAAADDISLLHRSLDQPLDPVTFARVRAVVEHGVADRLDGRDGGHGEHRLQAALMRHHDELGWVTPPQREFPAMRPGGGIGYIDFLRLDEHGTLHVIETKIGDDEFLVLQGLDYWMWASANELLLRAHFGHAKIKRIIIDFVLGEPDGTVPQPSAPILSSYVPAQLEALAAVIDWRVWRVSSWATETPELRGLGERAVPRPPQIRRRP